MIYRTPDTDLEIFRAKLEEALFFINNNNKSCILLGDFNVDLSRDDAAKNDFINTLQSLSFFPTVNTYTRVTHSTKSIIDNFITNVQNSTFVCGTILSDISDHFPIVLFIDLPARRSLTHHKMKIKILNDETIRHLSEDLQAKAWYRIYNYSDPDAVFESD